MCWSPLVQILQHSPPTKCLLPAGGGGGPQAGAGAAEMCCGHLLLGQGELGWCWGEYTGRHRAGAGVPGDTSVPCPREPRLFAPAPLPPFFPAQITIMSVRVGPGTGCC